MFGRRFKQFLNRGWAGARVLVRWPAVDDGDVPGWVMITVMTAGIVAALWVFVGPRFIALLSRAFSHLTG